MCDTAEQCHKFNKGGEGDHLIKLATISSHPDSHQNEIVAVDQLRFADTAQN